jgi:glycosyltransferase involved in cell wall biosynthesis
MRILELYGEDYPWDVRVEKLLTGLAGGGHECHLLCRNLKRRPLREKSGEIHCHRVLPPESSSIVHKALSLPSPVNLLWYRALKRVHAEAAPELIIVRDLPLAPLGIFFGRRHGIPVLIDFAENHPAMWDNVLASDRFPVRSWLMKNPTLARRMEKKVVGQADMMFVVVEEMRDHLLALGADPERIRIVSNTPPLRSMPDGHGETASGDKDLKLVFVGNLTRNRGLQQVLKAMAGLPAGGPGATFDIVGSGDYAGTLADLAGELGIADQVVFHGWVDNTRIPDLIGHCNVGVIPHLKTEHTDTTIPNKLFDFMALGLPVLVSDADPLRRIVDEEDCGTHFRCGDTKSLIDALLTFQSPDRRRLQGTNGRQGVEKRYHWEFDLAVAREAVGGLVSPVDGTRSSARTTLEAGD